MHHLPNLITLLRFLLIVPTGWCIVAGRYELAFVLFLVAGISDAVDGWLARQFSWITRVGAIADPVVDKLLVAVVYVCLAHQGVLPVWLAVLVLARDLAIFAGALSYHLIIERLEVAPTRLGKANTLGHILFVGMVLASITRAPLDLLAPLVTPGIWLITALTVVSGLDYVRTWATLAWRRRPGIRDHRTGDRSADHG